MSETTICPQCKQQLTQVGDFWICPKHGQVSTHPSSVGSHPLRIFISYGHDANEELVRRIKADLEERGHDVWFDKNDIKFGDDWRRAITDGITDSNRVLSFLSKHSTRDPGVCLDEVAIAISVKGCNIQTILVECEAEVQPPPSIGHIQWLDMHDWKERRTADPVAFDTWYKDRLAEIVRVVESDESLRFAGEIDTLCGYLRPITSDSRISTLLCKGFVGRDWLTKAIERWRIAAAPASRLFWITGKPGTGKSAFAAHLTHKLGKGAVIAVEFCQWHTADHRDAHQIVRSLAFQLATRLPDYRRFLLSLPGLSDLDQKDADGLFDYLLSTPLRTCIQGGRERHLIVIDALDEAGSTVGNPLVELLVRHTSSLPDWLGLVITSRPEFHVEIPLQGEKNISLDQFNDQNEADIVHYLRTELAEQLKGRADTDSLIRHILRKSEGVFLYTEHFCDGIRHGHYALDSPDQFPRGLGGIYCQWFKRQFPHPRTFAESIRPALGATLAAREPLPLALLRSILHWRNYDLADFTRTVGSLFPIAREPHGEVIKPCHQSLAEWLTTPSFAGDFFVSVPDGHHLLADAGWAQFLQRGVAFDPYFQAHLARHLVEANQFHRLVEILADSDLGLFRRWADGGYDADGVFCLRRLLAVATPRLVQPAEKAALTTQLARVYLRQGRLDEAAVLLGESLKVSDGGSPNRVLVIATYELGSIAAARGLAAHARSWYRRSLKVARSATPPFSNEIALNLLGIAHTYYMMHATHTARVTTLAQRALRSAQENNNLLVELEAVRLLADVNKDHLDYEQAERYLENGIARASAAKLPFALLALLTAKGWLQYQRAALIGLDPAGARATFEQVLSCATQHHNEAYQSDAWSGLAQCAILNGDLHLAKQAVSWLQRLRPDPMFAYAHVRCALVVASLLHRNGCYRESSIAFEDALTLANTSSISVRQADAHVGLGAALYHLGDSAEAERHWLLATAISKRCPPIRQRLVARSIGLARCSDTATPL